MKEERLDLFDLSYFIKNLAIRDLSQEKNSAFGELSFQGAIISLKFQIASISLQELCKSSEVSPLCYLKSKDSEREDLALSYCQKFQTEEELLKLFDLIKKPGTIFFGGRRFDQEQKASKEWTSFGEQFYFLPRLWFSSNKKEKTTLTLFFNQSEIINQKINGPLLFELQKLLNFHQKDHKGEEKKNHDSISYDHQTPEKNGWNKNIQECLNQFNQKTKKIVLSRKQVYKVHFNRPLATFLQKEKQNKNHYIFLLKIDEDHTFFSLSPEKLFKIENDIITSDAIAGTRSRNQDQLIDKKLEQELLNSAKELNEHRIVSKHIEGLFQNACQSYKQIEKETLLKLKTVQHIKTSYQGKLKKSQDLLELIKKFHPTPAVGAYPKEKAFSLIKSLEKHDRGFYSAPVGVLSFDYSEIIVAIRSTLLYKKDLHFYAGAGIVPDSQAEPEWIETQKKMNTIKEYIL